MRRPRLISLENKIEALRAKMGASNRSFEDSETFNDLEARVAEVEDAIAAESAIDRRLTSLEKVIERWRSRIQGAAFVIGGSFAFLTAALLIEPVRGSLFSSLFPTEKRFGDVASLMREPRQGAQEAPQLEEYRSTLTAAVFSRSEAEAGIMSALAKYGEAAAADRSSDSEEDRAALALYKEAIGRHLFDYLDRNRRPLVVGMFTRPAEHSKANLIKATLSAGSDPFFAKLEGIGSPEREYKCGGSFSNSDLAVELALRPDIYDDFLKSKTLQFFDCRNKALPRVIISIATASAQVQRIAVRGVVRGVYDANSGNPIYTLRATDAVMSGLGLSTVRKETAQSTFFVQDAQYESTVLAASD